MWKDGEASAIEVDKQIRVQTEETTSDTTKRNSRSVGQIGRRSGRHQVAATETEMKEKKAE